MAGKVRVFHLIKSLGRGGAEVLLEEGLRFADVERFEYRYGYFLPWKNAVVPGLEASGVEVTCYGGRNNVEILLGARRVARDLRVWGADVLHCHLGIAGVVGRVAARIAGVPVVYTEHNKLERLHPLTRRLNLATWRWQDCVIAVSDDVADSIRGHTPASVPVRVVLNGVDVGRYDRRKVDATAVRRTLGIPPEARVIGTVAVFTAKKRLNDWLEAARLIHEQHPDSRFILAGDGPLREEVTAQIQRSGLSEVVHLVGFQDEVRPYLAAMDVYLMSSAFEGLPIALLEAMSMECVPVCTAVGGIPEVILPGGNGFLAPAEQPQELARQVGGVLDDRTRLGAFGAAARRTIEEHFSMSRMTRELEAIYIDVLEGRRNGR